MKGKLPLLCLMVLWSYLGTAQITITSDDYVSPLGDTIVNVNVFNLTLIGEYYVPPAEGVGQTWDYRWLELTTQNLDPEPEVSSQSFPMANSIDETTIIADFTPDTPLPINLIERYDDSGKAILGEEIVSTVTVPFVCSSCTDADSVRYEPVTNAFEEAEQLLQLPLTFDDSWSSSYTRTINMQLFLPAFSLNDVAAQQVDNVQVDHEVVGWGTLTLPNLTYSGLQEIEVLLVKQTTSETSNYTVDGGPAPQAILDTLGITDGQETVTTFYHYFAKGLDQPALSVGFSGDGQVLGYTVAGSIGNINPDEEGRFFPNAITHDGNDRSYFLYIPPGYDGNESLPLVVALHGYTSTATQMAWQSHMNYVADTAGFIVVYPQGLLVNGLPVGPLPPRAPGWNIPGGPITAENDDVGFIISVIDEVIENYSVNEQKVYATGQSNGGFMSCILASARPDRIAAIGVSAGLFPAPRTALVPTLAIHGTNDPLVPFDGNPELGFPPIPEIVGLYAATNGCNFLPDSTNLPDLDVNDGSTVTKFAYQGCNGNADVVFYRVNGGGHVWEGVGFVPPIFAPIIGPNVNKDIHAGVEIWNFLKQYELPNAQLLDLTLEHQDSTRKYLLYVPAAYDSTEAWPLVVNIHGLSVNRFAQVLESQMNAVADTAHFIVAYPEATLMPTPLGNLNSWNTFLDPEGPDDINFIEQLIDSIVSEYKLDSNRIYATGKSQGGEMTYLLACLIPDKIAAIASVSGLVSNEGNSMCTANQPMPVLHIHGTADLLVPFNGGAGVLAEFPTFPDVFKHLTAWTINNNCAMDSTVVDLPDINTADSSTVTLIKYEGCDVIDLGNGAERMAEVWLYQVDGGGHTWPGGPDEQIIPGLGAIIGKINRDINASSEIWNFFNRGQLATSTRSAEPSVFQIEVYPNPFSNELNFEFELSRAERVQLALYNPLGQQVAHIVNQQLGQGKQRIQWRKNGTALPAGVYYYRLQIGERLVSRPVIMR